LVGGLRGGGEQRQLLADAVEEELEAVAEPFGGIGSEGRGGELVLDPVHGQLRLPGAALGQLDLRLFFDGVAEHVVERGKGGPAGPVRRQPCGLEDLDDHVAEQDGVGLGHVGAGHDPGAIAVGQEHLA
jgi:hypothetical protein